MKDDCRKMIGIQSALEKEIELIREQMANATTQRRAGLDYVVGRITGAEVVAVAGGVGKVRAASCAQSLVDLFHVESVIFCGVAGCLNPSLKVGDVVISQDLFQHDYIADTKTAILGKISARFNESRVGADENLVRLAQTACTDVLGERSCVVGTVVTGDKPVLTRTARTRLRRKYGAECVDMEGAAVGAVCDRNGVPFVVLRAVSDSAGFLTPLEFKRNLSATSERVQQVMLRLLALNGQ
jgi:adenosylhomocysteine nucleosidase